MPSISSTYLHGSYGWSTLGLIAAALVDYAIGDPWHWPHPVQGMGWVINQYTRRVIDWQTPAPMERGLGVMLAILLIGGSGGITWLLLHGITQMGGPGLRTIVEITMVASCFAGRSLRRAAGDVLQPLADQDLAKARHHLARYVGRDTETLSVADMLRAILETVSENATDGVLAPLFYAVLGAGLGWGPAPLAMAYKAASTLDSMVGYKRAPYTYLGWASARLEDALTWLPCRLVVLSVGLLSGQPCHVWQVCRRDAIADPSPNAGWSECAYAAALGVQIGGPNQYRGQLIHKPKLGNAEHPITPKDIETALGLTRHIFLLWLLVGSGGLWLYNVGNPFIP